MNYLAILVAAAAYFLLGGLWYALAFTKPWMAALDFSPTVKAKAEDNDGSGAIQDLVFTRRK